MVYLLCIRDLASKKYNQGYFRPQHPEKYIGDSRNIIYRSSWELKFLRWCDRNENILKYASEEFSIPYVSPLDRRVHRYYPDYLIEVKKSDGTIKKYIVEVKPKKQTVPPVKKDRITKSYIYEAKTYAVNEAKWKAAQEFALDSKIKLMTSTL